MASDLHALLKKRGFSIYVDLRLLGRALRDRLPFAAARRRAEYVLIDARRIPLGYDMADFTRRFLTGVRIQDGLGFTRHGPSGQAPRLVDHGADPLPQAVHRRINLSGAARHDRQPMRSEP